MDLVMVKKASKLLAEIEEMKKQIDEYNKDVKKQEKELRGLKKSQDDEIVNTIKSKRNEIEYIYDETINKHKEMIKKIKSKRSKEKDLKVEERIDTETEPVQTINKKLKAEITFLFRQNKISTMFNSKWYFSVYFTNGFEELIILFLTILMSIVALPYAIYYLFFPLEVMYLIISYIATFLVVGGIYIFINNITKVKHRDVFLEARGKMNEINRNRRKIKRITKDVTKDKDDAQYNLEEYDTEIQNFEEEIVKVEKERAIELEKLDNEISVVIEAEIKEKYKESIDEIQNILQETKSALLELEKKLNDSNIIYTKEYDVYIGKEFGSNTKLDEIIKIMEEGSALTFMEAVNLYRSNKTKS